MNGLLLNWTCTKCGTKMHDHIRIIMLYNVNDKNDFACMKCDVCGHIHFVNTKDDTIVIASEDANVEKSDVCCF